MFAGLDTLLESRCGAKVLGVRGVHVRRKMVVVYLSRSSWTTGILDDEAVGRNNLDPSVCLKVK